MKRCTKCGEEKSREAFYVVDKTTGRLNSQCKPCVIRATGEYVKANKAKRNAWARGRYQTNPEVKQCQAQKQREYRKRHPERARATDRNWKERNRDRIRQQRKARDSANRPKHFANMLRYYYGMTVEDWAWLFHSQRGRCNICRHPFEDADGRWSPCVDHCHKTGRVRGLLCDGCNSAIGLLSDSPENFKRAIGHVTEGSSHVVQES